MHKKLINQHNLRRLLSAESESAMTTRELQMNGNHIWKTPDVEGEYPPKSTISPRSLRPRNAKQKHHSNHE